MPLVPTRSPYAAGLRAQLDCPDAWRTQALAALAVAGVTVDDTAAVGIGVSPGRAVSATVDDWSVASLPHLLVAVTPWSVEVGPWAAPGLGPCARCVAASVLDDRPEALAAEVPRPLLALAVGTAARDLAAWAAGETPYTWLTSWRHDHQQLPTQRRWARHPYCGCAWFDTA
ncbi:hypothetical protein L2K70_19880 [Nocardioides KLBMP 9356]|uniref:TOMM leader peptide-binding protein n=1 Tax=Nocardioides potassii TaxID=2911371 RepID=A0ABS9HI06_9ACTN|nr:hypothetical protein [Nocardioides potassii]MCF6379879.1 hypothetical protein [Nocardioides potassii]